jgi:uncharacterized protein (TIGR03118 family)
MSEKSPLARLLLRLTRAAALEFGGTDTFQALCAVWHGKGKSAAGSERIFVMRSTGTSHRNLALASCLTALLWSAGPASAGLIQVNLVSNVPGVAMVTDPLLINAWGMASSPTSPWWISDNGTGVSTLYNGNNGAKSALTVTIPTEVNGTPPSAPTGLVFNNTAGFALPGGAKSTFIFATENGTIAGWNGAQGTTAFNKVDMSAGGTVFKGLAIGSVGAANYLYATDFTNGAVRVFDTTFAPAALSGNFTDPILPAGYVPFGIKNLGGKIYVTYALGNGHDETDGPGLGVVDVFDTNGNLLSRVASGGPLDAPWGLTIAPAGFDAFGNDLLVGNFGDGKIDAYDPSTFAFMGQLLDLAGQPIQIDGLWDLNFGNGGSGGPKNSLFFSAGPDGESNGLFGDLQVPEPVTLSVFGVGLVGAVAMRRRRKTR